MDREWCREVEKREEVKEENVFVCMGGDAWAWGRFGRYGCRREAKRGVEGVVQEVKVEIER